MLIKLFAKGFKTYCADGFNIFDAIVNILSVIDIMMPDVDSNMLAFRAIRLFRIFKVVKTQKNIRVVLVSLLESMTAVSNLILLVFIFCLTSALICK